jgi:carotenoid cleavage dioxygenase-like enzyme
LAYQGAETFDGMLASGGLTVTTGLGEGVDRALGLGVAFTAHPREDRKRGRMVGWSWAAPLAGDQLQIKIMEWDFTTGAVLHETRASLPSAIAPHDFAITDNYYVYALNAMELRLAPFVLGLTGPVGALLTTGGGVSVARPHTPS